MSKTFPNMGPAFLLLILFSVIIGQAADLTPADRVTAQEAIERVYYSHQVGAEKPFEQAVPREVLQRKVDRYLKQSAALETFWHIPVTAKMLERELQRMSRGTRMPQRLQELFAALDHDPVLIQECLARATLVDRLTRNFHASGSRFEKSPPDETPVEKATWDQWWSEVAPTLDAASVATVASREVSVTSGLQSVPCVADDTWDNGALADVPEPRNDHTAVWTGTEMIVWGGSYSSGARYDPVADGYSECDGDCNDGTPLVYPWAPELCDGYDNQCPGEFGQGHVDVGCNSDGDGYCDGGMITIGFPASCPHGGADCNDVNLYVYPGAPEVNDGIDNQCPGDHGYGIVDETSGFSGFADPSDYSWPAQAGATLYEVVRSATPDFSLGCIVVTTSETAIPSVDPAPGGLQFYLNRPIAPHVGSWGGNSHGQPRVLDCLNDVAAINSILVEQGPCTPGTVVEQSVVTP